MITTAQNIALDGNDNEKSYGIFSSIVNIVASPTSSINAFGKSSSSSLMVSPLVSYDWEYRYYLTKLLTNHSTSGNAAWFIKGKQSKALVRVTYGETRIRSLLTNFDSSFLMLEFSSHCVPILAVLSFDGVLKIFHINHVDSVNSLLITVNLNEGNSTLTHFGLKWGPKLVAPKEHEDTSLLLAVSLNKEVYVIDFNGVVEQLSPNSVDFDTASAYYQSYPRLLGKMMLRLSDLSSNVEAMAFSSDASTFFVSENVGKIFMFKMSDIRLESFGPCHEWLTPESAPLSALYCVDSKDETAFKRYLIGGTGFNRNLFIWRLPDYSLIQTIRFCPSEEDKEALKHSVQPMLITQFDTTANLLFASDIKRTVLYVLHLSRNPEAPEGVRFQCISEFLLVNPCISFDVNRASRSLSLNRPFSTYKSEDSDIIEARLTLIFPGELKTGKLSFFVPLSTYMTRGPSTSVGAEEKQSMFGASMEEEPPSIFMAANDCPLPGTPEGDKNSAFGNPFNLLTRIFARRPTSASAHPFKRPATQDAPPAPPPTEKSASGGSSTPQAGSEHETTPPTQHWDDDNLPCGDVAETSEKSFNSTPINIDSGVAGIFLREPTLSPHPSEGSPVLSDQNQQPFWGLEGMGKFTELSDSVRSLAGSSSVASLSNLISRDPSVMDFSRPLSDVLTTDHLLTDPGPCPDETSIEVKITEVPLESSALPLTNHNISEEMDIRQMLSLLLLESKAQTAATKALTKKVQENKNQLTKLASVQATILKQINTLNTPSSLPCTSPSAGPTTTTPVWTTQMKDQLNKHNTETAKQLTQLQSSIKHLNVSVASMNSSSRQRSASTLDSRQLQSLQSQIHNVIRSELQSTFQLSMCGILEPLRQHLRVSLVELLDPLPKTVADRMLAVVVDPKFSHYFSSQISSGITPSIAVAYREELRREFVPALTKGVDKLTKELDELVKGALNQHLQSTISKIDTGVQSSRDKVEASARKFSEQSNQLSKDIASKVSVQINELLNAVVKEKYPSSPLASSAPSVAAAVGVGEAPLAAVNKEVPVKNPKPPTNNSIAKQKQKAPLQQGTAVVNSYQIALGFIQSQQYADALETALTSTNQAVLLKVLQNVPVVQLFRQNVKQELLLSLIHQLSCGYLKEQLEMKISFLQEAVNHLRLNDDTVKELGDSILSNLISKMSVLRGSGTLSPAEENRALVLLRTIQEKWQNRPLT